MNRLSMMMFVHVVLAIFTSKYIIYPMHDESAGFYAKSASDYKPEQLQLWTPRRSGLRTDLPGIKMGCSNVLSCYAYAQWADETLRIRDNVRFDKFAAFVGGENLDVVGVQELDAGWREGLIDRGFFNDYALIFSPQVDLNLGIFFNPAKVLLEGVCLKADVRCLAAKFRDLTTGTVFAVINVHARFGLLHESLDGLRNAVRMSSEIPTFVMGDFNTNVDIRPGMRNGNLTAFNSVCPVQGDQLWHDITTGFPITARSVDCSDVGYHIDYVRYHQASKCNVRIKDACSVPGQQEDLCWLLVHKKALKASDLKDMQLSECETNPVSLTLPIFNAGSKCNHWSDHCAFKWTVFFEEVPPPPYSSVNQLNYKFPPQYAPSKPPLPRSLVSRSVQGHQHAAHVSCPGKSNAATEGHKEHDVEGAAASPIKADSKENNDAKDDPRFPLLDAVYKKDEGKEQQRGCAGNLYKKKRNGE